MSAPLSPFLTLHLTSSFRPVPLHTHFWYVRCWAVGEAGSGSPVPRTVPLCQLCWAVGERVLVASRARAKSPSLLADAQAASALLCTTVVAL